MIAWLELIALALKLLFSVWEAIKEHNLEKKKLQTEELQRGLRGIVDRDPSRVTASLAELNRLRK